MYVCQRVCVGVCAGVVGVRGASVYAYVYIYILKCMVSKF